MTTVYLTHGYTAHPDKHWFPWLEQQLAETGIQCVRLEMPDPSHPSPEAWLEYHKRRIRADENTIFVGHSLGCLATLIFLTETRQKVKGAVFVSGFYEPLPNLPELDDFANFYRKRTACMPAKSFVLASLTDKVVNHRFSERFARHLDAQYILLAEGGHFLDREGITELPEVLELVRQLSSE